MLSSTVARLLQSAYAWVYSDSDLVLALVDLVEELGGVLEAIIGSESLLIDGVLDLVGILAPSLDSGELILVLRVKVR